MLDPNWENERNVIFEPVPFKGDENMLVDAKDRAALDDDEGANQLLVGFNDNKKTEPANAGGESLLPDLDSMLVTDAPSS
mmetsp:Transcript_21890/g.33988  ORF Transcript_21890/g.33988 Transcript_21890/m.33988 type:complete len:80 (+) Transcript_21890:1764-2003(+)